MKKEKKIPVEVYSRVVGYYRMIKHWHQGKREEFRERQHFSVKKIEDRINGCL